MVYGEHLPGDPGGLIGGKKADGIGLILHGALGHIVQGHMAVALGGKIRIKGGNLIRGVQCGGSGARADHVDPDVARSKFQRNILAHADDGGFAVDPRIDSMPLAGKITLSMVRARKNENPLIRLLGQVMSQPMEAEAT